MKKSKMDALYISSLNNTISRYIYHLQGQLGFGPCAKKKGKVHEGHYPFIPSGHSSRTLSYLHMAREHICKKRGDDYRPNFLDCGCGIGNIMLLARAIGGFDKVDGIEYDLATYKVAKVLAHSYDNNVFKGDLVKSRRFGNYDVIYYYEPISDQEKRMLFFGKLANNTKVGTIIISNSGSSYFSENRKFKSIRRESKGLRYPIYEKMRM